jgi:PAS domain S-box-containing protein/diguanylate cyclase (GGDEF)-like protein
MPGDLAHSAIVVLEPGLALVFASRGARSLLLREPDGVEAGPMWLHDALDEASRSALRLALAQQAGEEPREPLRLAMRPEVCAPCGPTVLLELIERNANGAWLARLRGAPRPESRAAPLVEPSLLFENMTTGFALHEILTDEQGAPVDYRFVQVNPAYEALTGLRAQDLLGRRVLEILPGTESFWIQAFGEVALGAPARELENYSSELGRWYHVRVFSPRRGSFAVMIADITQRKQLELAVLQSERLFRTIFEQAPACVALIRRGKLHTVNSAFLEAFGYERASELEGVDMLGLLDAGQRADVAGQMQAHSDPNPAAPALRTRGLRADGQAFPLLVSLRQVHVDADSEPSYLMIGIDLSEREQHEHAIDHLRRHDALTDLYNARAFEEAVARAGERSAAEGGFACVALLELDGMASINEGHGRSTGDEFLRAFARRLRACTDAHAAPARIENARFAVLLNLRPAAAASADQALGLAREQAVALQAAIGHPHLVDGKLLPVRTTLGLVVFQGSEIHAHELVRRAAIAARHARQDSVEAIGVFETWMLDAVMRRHATESALREAIGAEQFRLHYQLQFDHERRVIGAEALLRWQHPEQGLLGPGSFLDLAEQCGQMDAVGRWVLRRACLDLRSMMREGLDAHLLPPLSVNVTASEFHREDFLPRVSQILQTTGVKAGSLKLELTEGMLLSNSENTVRRMTQLKEMGFQLSLDDFGTGFSSLAYLRHFPFDEIKIDQAFVRALEADRQTRAIVVAIVNLAEKLGLRVIAEGVETDAQWQILMESGCRRFQGFLLARPQPLEDMLERLGPASRAPELARGR